MKPILPSIHNPKDVQALPEDQLDALCVEIREKIIETVSRNGGHLASNLGVVELTVALARVFPEEEDGIVWDVGHQCYPYKLITDRVQQFSTIRQGGGLSGFPNRKESAYDHFTTGHSSTSISTALGMVTAKSLQNQSGHVVAVIGDGALTGGLAYEGLNNAGRFRKNFIVILNDNNRSISKNVGSIARYLRGIRSRPGYIQRKSQVEHRLSKLSGVGNVMTRGIRRAKKTLRRMLDLSNIFEDLGFAYYGPFDGHNIEELTRVLKTARMIPKPVLIHVCTEKGRGYHYAEQDPGAYHGISKFNRDLGRVHGTPRDFSAVFGETLCKLAGEEPRLCAITAAMEDGTGLGAFRSQFPHRFFDVGIAEGHGVAFAGGLAERGMIPVFAVYSTFLQRGYDQLIHDVALQDLKVILGIDRAGLVGEDGKSHQGIFDPAYLQMIPGVTVYSPSYFEELALQLTGLIAKGQGLCAIRYPRGKEFFKPSWHRATGENFDSYGSKRGRIGVVTYGRIFSFAAETMEKLAAEGIDIRLVKLNRIIPLDPAAVNEVRSCQAIYFFEEAVQAGGIGEHFAAAVLTAGFTGKMVIRAIGDAFIEQAAMEESLAALGLSPECIYQEIAGGMHGTEDKT